MIDLKINNADRVLKEIEKEESKEYIQICPKCKKPMKHQTRIYDERLGCRTTHYYCNCEVKRWR